MKDAARTVQFYDALVARLVDVVLWMNLRLDEDRHGTLGSAATKYAVHKGLERWADPQLDPHIDAARQAAIILLAAGQTKPQRDQPDAPSS
jgi:hypothetical protein